MAEDDSKPLGSVASESARETAIDEEGRERSDKKASSDRQSASDSSSSVNTTTSASSVSSKQGSDGDAPSQAQPSGPTPTVPPPNVKQQRQQSSSSNQGTSTRQVIPTVAHSGIRLVPALFQHCELADIIALVSSMLDRLLEYNDSLPPAETLTRFHSKAAPGITPSAYLTRITTFINVDPCILIILLYYIDRLSNYLTINSLTLHRFLISAICCGSKALSDSFATNSRYAKVGGVELVEMNALEREFLIAIDWRLATSGVMLEQYWRSLVEAHPAYQLAPPPTTFAPPRYLNPTPSHQSQPVPSPNPTAGRPIKRAKSGGVAASDGDSAATASLV